VALINRRGVVIGLPLLVGLGAQSAMAEGGEALAELEKRHSGRLGMFALDTGTGRTLAYRQTNVS
jgi:beta-lactamase class A